MKKFRLDKKYFAVSCYALAVIVLSIISFRIISNIEILGGLISNVFAFAVQVLRMFVYGGFIAFFLNAPVRLAEKFINRAEGTTIRATARGL